MHNVFTRGVNRARLLQTLIATLLLAVVALPTAFAHHSAALFYSMEKRITVQGEVARFNFRNPHAIVELLVKGENGEVIRWTCETSAPSALRRRGWSQESILAGEMITIEGVPAVDGSRLLRILSATKADGTEVGVTGRLDD
jgi:hypothetical protein